MDQGTPWTRLLFRDDVLISAQSSLWSGGRDGGGYYYFCQPGGFAPGDYQVQFFIDASLAARAMFMVGGGGS